MTDDVFKLPGSSYAEVAKIIRAYGLANDNAVPKDVADRAGMDPTNVSRNNGFLVSLGILTPGKKKSLTSAGRSLAQALDYEIPEQISVAWRALVSENEFFKKILSAVRIRGGMEVSSLRSHVAYTAGAPKKSASMTGAGTVIDVLTLAGYLTGDESGGSKVFATSREDQPLSSLPSKEQVAASPTETNPVSPPAATPPALPMIEHALGDALLQIQIRVDCKPAELSQLGDQLRALLRALREQSDSNPSDE